MKRRRSHKKIRPHVHRHKSLRCRFRLPVLHMKRHRSSGGIGLRKILSAGAVPAAVYLILTAAVLIGLPLGVVGLFRELGILNSPQATGTVEMPKTIKVYRTETKKVESVDFEEYVKGVVAGEMPAAFEKEALKAQAVAARTYSLSKYLKENPEAHPKAPLCDDVHCQVYRSVEELETLKGEDWMRSREYGWKKICAAVDATKGEVMYYDSEVVQYAFFHSSSGGNTENCEDVFVSAVPYLKSVKSPYEKEATHLSEKKNLSLVKFKDALEDKYPDRKTGTLTSGSIKILSRTEGGRVKKIRVGDAIYTGVEIRTALGLYSANFKVTVTGGKISFTTTGSGHGVGMSQYGANGMAKKGADYKAILKHYYTGVQVK